MANVKDNSAFKFKSELNKTDPIVYFDGSASNKILIEKYSQNSNEVNAGDEINYNEGRNIEYDNTKVIGIRQPLVKLNNNQLRGEDIDYFNLKCEDFYPTLDIMINDYDGKYFKNDRPGLNNTVTVVILPKLDGKYKGIKCDFYIEDYNKISSNKFLCKCRFKFLDFEQKETKVIKNKSAITSTKDGETCISTFDMIKSIALENGFGFQATENCKDINDKRTHFLQREKILDFIPRQISFGGTNRDEIFDAFIDLNGYFTLINLPWVFNLIEGKQNEKGELEKEEYTKENYSIFIECGTHTEDTNLGESEFMEVYRVLTNLKNAGGETNLTYNEKNLKTIINNYDLTQQEGTMKNYYYCVPYGGAKDANGVLSFDMKIIENSLEGRGENSLEYEFKNEEFLGFDMSDEEPTMEQKENVKLYKKKLHKEEITIKLDKTNFGLTRGKVIFLDYLEYDQQRKRKLLYNYDNSNKKTNIETVGEIDIKFEEIINNNSFGLPDMSFCGFYYISAVNYFYERGNNNLSQTITLVKNFKINNNTKYNNEILNSKYEK